MNYEIDGFLIVDDGKVVVVGLYVVFVVMFVCDVVVYDLCDKLIVFGFIDMYIYYL